MKNLIKMMCLFAIIPFMVIADDHSPQVIADSWVMVPKAGHQDKFEAALKAHLDYRKENGDTRNWQTYQPVTGGNLNRYIVRFCCEPWAKQDEYVAWSNKNMSEHFAKNVAPHVETYMHNFTETDMKNSNWPAGTKANYVGVTEFKMKPGKYSDSVATIEQMSNLAKEKKWPRNWAWSYPVGGEEAWLLATPFESYADMAPMEQSFYEFAVKHMGSAGEADAMFAKYSDAYTSADYTIYRHVKSLSMSTE